MLFSKATFMVLTIAASANGQTLGTAAAYGVLAGTTITNTGLTVVNARIGLSPGTSITGFGTGMGTSNGQDINNGAAVTAKADAAAAYAALVALPPTMDLTGTDLGSRTLFPGVYTFSSSGGLTGALTLDAQNNANALFVFKFGSTITTASGSAVNLINGAQACNVFWQVGSSATFGTGTTFIGNVLARTSITVTTGTSLRRGGFYALDAAVTLDTNAIDQGGACGVAPPDPSTTTSATSIVTLPTSIVTLPTISLPISLPTITLPTIIVTPPANTITSTTDIVVTSTTTSTVTNPASTTTITISVPITVTQTISASTTTITSTTTKYSTKPWTKTASATKCPTKTTSTKKATSTKKSSTKAQNYKRARSTKTKTVTTTCAGYTKTQKGSQATHTVKATRAYTSTVWKTKQATTTSTFTQYPACTNNPKAKRDYERMFG